MTDTPRFANRCEGHALKEVLRTLLQDVFDDPAAIASGFTEDYRQHTDGRSSDRAAFEHHVRHVAAAVSSLHFTVLDAVWQGDMIADRHRVDVRYPDGRTACIEVCLFGRLRDGRFAEVHEWTHVIDGTQADQALGSAA